MAVMLEGVFIANRMWKGLAVINVKQEPEV
jgi:hypothetical protein